MSCAIGIIAVGSVTWGVGIFSTIPSVYQQLAGYGSETATGMSSMSVQQWAQLNHTLVILDDNVMKSIFTVTAKEEPYRKNVTITIDFGKYSTLVPRIIDGELFWSGKFNEDIRLNQTIILQTTLGFDNDGEYRLSGTATTYSYGGYEGIVTNYYITVTDGKIVKVTDKPDFGGAKVESEPVDDG